MRWAYLLAVLWCGVSWATDVPQWKLETTETKSMIGSSGYSLVTVQIVRSQLDPTLPLGVGYVQREIDHLTCVQRESDLFRFPAHDYVIETWNPQFNQWDTDRARNHNDFGSGALLTAGAGRVGWFAYPAEVRAAIGPVLADQDHDGIPDEFDVTPYPIWVAPAPPPPPAPSDKFTPPNVPFSPGGGWVCFQITMDVPGEYRWINYYWSHNGVNMAGTDAYGYHNGALFNHTPPNWWPPGPSFVQADLDGNGRPDGYDPPYVAPPSTQPTSQPADWPVNPTTMPAMRDQDGDGFSDHTEAETGTDYHDAGSNPGVVPGGGFYGGNYAAGGAKGDGSTTGTGGDPTTQPATTQPGTPGAVGGTYAMFAEALVNLRGAASRLTLRADGSLGDAATFNGGDATFGGGAMSVSYSFILGAGRFASILEAVRPWFRAAILAGMVLMMIASLARLLRQY